MTTPTSARSVSMPDVSLVQSDAESDQGTGLLRGRARGVAARIRGRMAMRRPSAPGACRVQCGPRMPASGRMLKN
jgi:hypothetical protein